MSETSVGIIRREERLKPKYFEMTRQPQRPRPKFSRHVKTASSVSLVLVMCFCDAEAANFVLQGRAF